MIDFVLSHVRYKAIEHFFLFRSSLVEPTQLDFFVARDLRKENVIASTTADAAFPFRLWFTECFSNFGIDNDSLKRFELGSIRCRLDANNAQREAFTYLRRCQAHTIFFLHERISHIGYQRLNRLGCNIIPR